MVEVERGIVTQELKESDSWQQLSVSVLGIGARNLLRAHLDPFSSDTKSRSWDELNDREQKRASGELIQIPELGVNVSVSKLVRSGLSPDTCQVVSNAVMAYQESLPFASSELRWLGGMCWTAERRKRLSCSPRAVNWIMSQRSKGEIVSSGQRQIFNGTELMNRQWDWIRGADKYEGNSTYNNATKAALQGIASLFED